MEQIADISPRTAIQASRNGHHSWTSWALGIIEGDNCRSADTHLVKAKFAGLRGISVYFKDESTHPTGSLKHRLARSLFLYSICNGWIREGTTIIEASSGSTAVSEAYFADLLNLPFIAVMSRSTRPALRRMELMFQVARVTLIGSAEAVFGGP